MKKPLLILACCGLLLAALLACGGSDANTGTATNTTSTPVEKTPTPAPAKHFKINQAVTVGDVWKITINSVKTDMGTEFLKPKDGNVYLLIDVSLNNVSNKEQDASSGLMWHLRDLTGKEYNQTYASSDNTAPDGKVEAGSPLRGILSYEVPQDQKKFTLSFEANFLDAGQTIWDLSL